MIWEQLEKFKEVERNEYNKIVEDATDGQDAHDVTDVRGRKVVPFSPRAALLSYCGIVVAAWALILLFVIAF